MPASRIIPISSITATKQCQRAMRLFYHNLPCLASHGDLYSEKPLMLLNSFQPSARV